MFIRINTTQRRNAETAVQSRHPHRCLSSRLLMGGTRPLECPPLSSKKPSVQTRESIRSPQNTVRFTVDGTCAGLNGRVTSLRDEPVAVLRVIVLQSSFNSSSLSPVLCSIFSLLFSHYVILCYILLTK